MGLGCSGYERVVASPGYELVRCATVWRSSHGVPLVSTCFPPAVSLCASYAPRVLVCECSKHCQGVVFFHLFFPPNSLVCDVGVIGSMRFVRCCCVSLVLCFVNLEISIGEARRRGETAILVMPPRWPLCWVQFVV